GEGWWGGGWWPGGEVARGRPRYERGLNHRPLFWPGGWPKAFPWHVPFQLILGPTKPMRSTPRPRFVPASRVRAGVTVLRRALVLSAALALIGSTLGAAHAAAASVIEKPNSSISTTGAAGLETFT